MHVARASLGNQPISGLELKPHGITKCTSLINLPDGKTSKQRPKTKCYGPTDESHFLWALDLGHNCYEHYVNDVSCSTDTPRNWRLYQLRLTPPRTLPTTLGTLELGASWFYVHNGLEPKPHHNNNGQIYQWKGTMATLNPVTRSLGEGQLQTRKATKVEQVRPTLDPVTRSRGEGGATDQKSNQCSSSEPHTGPSDPFPRRGRSCRPLKQPKWMKWAPPCTQWSLGNGITQPTYWERTGITPPNHWQRTGIRLPTHWERTGKPLPTHWERTGIRLPTHWQRTGITLPTH